MRFVATALAVVVCWALTTSAVRGEPYESKDGKFKITFFAGSKPVEAKKPKEKDGVEMHSVKADTPDGKMCVVIYMEVPALKMVGAKELFDSAEKAAAPAGATIMGTKDSLFGADKLPSREFVVAHKDGRKVKIRMIVNGTRVYTITIGDLKDFAIDPNKEADKVLDTFEIVPAK